MKKNRPLASRIVQAIVLILMGFGLLAQTQFAVVDLIRGPVDISQVSIVELEGKYVKAEIHAVFDNFAYESEGAGISEREVTQYYIIPLAKKTGYVPGTGESYIALSVPNASAYALNQIEEETWDVITGDAEHTQTTHTVTGTVVALEGELLEYYEEWFADTMLEKKALTLMLEDGLINGSTTGTIVALSAVSALLILAGLVSLFVGRQPKADIPQAYTANGQSDQEAANLSGLDPELAKDYQKRSRGKDPWDM